MQQIINFLTSISQLLVGLVKFIPKLLMDLLMVIDLTLQAVAQLPAVLVVFPTAISAIILSIFGVAVIYKVLGREG